MAADRLSRSQLFHSPSSSDTYPALNTPSFLHPLTFRLSTPVCLFILLPRKKASVLFCVHHSIRTCGFHSPSHRDTFLRPLMIVVIHLFPAVLQSEAKRGRPGILVLFAFCVYKMGETEKTYSSGYSLPVFRPIDSVLWKLLVQRRSGARGEVKGIDSGLN